MHKRSFGFTQDDRFVVFKANSGRTDEFVNPLKIQQQACPNSLKSKKSEALQQYPHLNLKLINASMAVLSDT